MTVSLPKEILELLAATPALTLAFADAQGPWAATLFFAANEAGSLWFTSSPRSRHGQLPHGSAVAVTVSPEPGDWLAIHGLQGAGRLERVPEDEMSEARTAYLERFPAISQIVAEPAGADEQRIAAAFLANPLYAVRLDRLRFIDNRRGFARREEWHRDGHWIKL